MSATGPGDGFGSALWSWLESRLGVADVRRLQAQAEERQLEVAARQEEFRRRGVELERALADLGRGHVSLAKGAANHLAALQAAAEASSAAIARLERSLADLGRGHAALAEGAATHLAALQAAAEASSSAITQLGRSQQEIDQSLRQALRLLDEAVSDLERGQTAIALAVKRLPAGGTARE